MNFTGVITNISYVEIPPGSPATDLVNVLVTTEFGSSFPVVIPANMVPPIGTGINIEMTVIPA